MKKLIVIYVLMLLLTASVALVANTFDSKIVVILLSAVKFILLSYYFMGLVNTHVIWRVFITIFLALFTI
ncbi:MAG: hypothetical protein IT256_05780, partial [Chitinophagaceae bacterium]|nr:hypothetical protein [Chitinophagaceae bacterium]